MNAFALPSSGTPPAFEQQDRLPSNESSSSPTPTGRPTYVELPKRPNFGASAPMLLPTASTDSAYSSVFSSSTPKSELFDPPIRVLVVDDDNITRKLMKRMLTRLGCTVSTAENGLVALELIVGEGHTPSTDSDTSSPIILQSGTPSSESCEDTGRTRSDGPRYEIVFLDNQMPVMSGLDTVAKLRSAGRTDFVVGVTGNALLTDQEAYMAAGVDHVITKPVFERSLKDMLSVAMERRRHLFSS